MSNTIHQKIADLLDMKMPDEDDDNVEVTASDNRTELVVVPDIDVEMVDNPELPELRNEMRRIEEGLRQNDEMLKAALAAAHHALGQIALLPPQYQPRAIEASATLFTAVTDVNKFKVESQLKLAELKMKLASFSRNRLPVMGPTSGDTTIIFNGTTSDVLKALHSQVSEPIISDTDEPT